MKTNNEPTICETNKYHTWVKRTLNSMPDDLICAHCGTHALMNLYGKDAMPQTQREHTGLPWKYTISSKNGRPQISGKDGHQVCLMWRDGEMQANANLIIKAVNSHYENISLLNDALKVIPLEFKDLRNEIKQALLTAQKEG